MAEKLNDITSLNRILENNDIQQQIVYKTLITIIENILKNPAAQEYRRIHLLSNELVENLMPFSGGLEFLFEIGFEEVTL
jgi:hypothetical protein